MSLQEKLKIIGGCGDGNCHVLVQRGMHTNGGCRCFKQNDGIKAQRVIRAYKDEVERLRGERDRMRAALTLIDSWCPVTCEMTLAHDMADTARQALGDTHD